MILSEAYHRTFKTEELRRKVDQVVSMIRKWQEYEPQFTISHMVVTGISGQALAWPISYLTSMPVCVVRKDNENHHGLDIQGSGILGDFIIVDDLIDSGRTIERIIAKIWRNHNDQVDGWKVWNVEPYPNPKPQPRAIFLGSENTHRDHKLTVHGENLILPVRGMR